MPVVLLSKTLSGGRVHGRETEKQGAHADLKTTHLKFLLFFLSKCFGRAWWHMPLCQPMGGGGRRIYAFKDS